MIENSPTSAQDVETFGNMKMPLNGGSEIIYSIKLVEFAKEK